MHLTPQARRYQNAVEITFVVAGENDRAVFGDIFPTQHARMIQQLEQRPDQYIK
jgi:hypothetical protein